MPHGSITQFTEGLTADAAPAGIVYSPGDGNFWFAEFNASRIGRVTSSGTITEFTLPAGRGPLNITVGPDNNLWFTENSGDRIGRINPTAGSDALIQASLTEFVVPGAGSAPGDIVAGPDGALWFTQTGSDEIGRITTAGVVSEFLIPGIGSAPSGITAGPDGALWFTQAGSGQIGRITTAGAITEFTLPVTSNGVSDPEDIVAGPDNALYFTDFARDQIGRISTGGEIFQYQLQFGRGPQQLVFRNGELTYTLAASGRIGALPISALQPGQPTSNSPDLEEFDFIRIGSVPLGIAVGANNDFFITLNAENAIGTFLDVPDPPPTPPVLPQITIAGIGSAVAVYDIGLNLLRAFEPLPGFRGLLALTVQDMNGNGAPDVVAAVGTAGLPIIAIYEGLDNSLIAAFFAYPPTVPAFNTGLTLAADDVDGDGRADLVVASGTFVKVIDGTKLGRVGADGVIADSALLGQFLAFPIGSMGSVSLTAGDLNRDGRAEVIVGAGPGAPPIVRVIDGARLSQGGIDAFASDAQQSAFFAFSPLDPQFRGGVTLAVAFNPRRDLIVGAGAGALPLVRVLNGSRVGELAADGQIVADAQVAAFLAFSPAFRGGVRLAADDLNADKQAEIIITPGDGLAPVIRVVNGARTGDLLPTGEIAPSGVFRDVLTGPPGFTTGISIAADADHRDGPTFGPPGVTLSGGRFDINDIFIFQSPVTATNTVLSMTVSPFSTGATPNEFAPNAVFDFRIANRDLVDTTDDLTFRVTFGPTGADGFQDVSVRAVPAALFAGSGGVIVKGLTGQNVAVRGVGGGGTAMFRAAEQDDPFLFDAAGFNRFLDGRGLSDGTTAAAAGAPTANRPYPSGTSNGGAGDSDADGLGFDVGETPDYNAPNFFNNANTLAIVLELPSTVLAGVPAGTVLTPEQHPIGFWGRSEVNGVQVDRMGRPAINTAVVPPIPRGPNNPIMPGTDLRNAFNAGHPRDDRNNFSTPVSSVIAAVYPIGQNGQAPVVASLLLPDILVYDPTSTAGFFGDTVGGNPGDPTFFLAGGRKFSDDIISTEVAVLTDPDTPFDPTLGPLITTQNVADDNGLNLTDGSIVGPGTATAGMQRAAVFPYIGARNPNPGGVPGGNPPP